MRSRERTAVPFTGLTAVVTGGSQGIGKAVLEQLIAGGATGICLDLLEPSEALANCRFIRCDVAERRDVERAFREIEEKGGEIDVLVNNAGIQRLSRTDELDFERWEHVVRVHLMGTYYCSALAMRAMKRRGGGSIVSIASVAALTGMPGRGAYSAAKAGIMGLTRVMAIEGGEAGVRANAVAPGFTRTRLAEQALNDGSLTEAGIRAEVPLGRMASPKEVAAVVCFLASSQASYVTGQTVVVDGGWSVQGLRAAV